MASMVIGSRGLLNADIETAQGCTLEFTVIHKDKDGNPINHSDSKIYLAFQGAKNYDLSKYCSGDDEAIYVDIPASITEKLPLTAMIYDLIVETEQYTQCLIYGNVRMFDTVAMD